MNTISSKKWILTFIMCVFAVVSSDSVYSASPLHGNRKIMNFDKDWKFKLGEVNNAQDPHLYDGPWRTLDLPHDWSIEGSFSKDHPASPGGGALPGGIGWYRKTFTLLTSTKDKFVFIEFDGVYRNCEVWINGQYLGKRPYGYSSFRYELTPFLKYGNESNVLAVKVDNSQQPNSRWYSGSGIYRNVWLVTTEKIHVTHWGTYVTTPKVTAQSANVTVQTKIRNTTAESQKLTLRTIILGNTGTPVSSVQTKNLAPKNDFCEFTQHLIVAKPKLWSIETPYLYTVVTSIEIEGKVLDKYETPFGIRSFAFDTAKGFLLNGKHVKINGVCNHHDLGFLGAAVNRRALERQLEIMKSMGVNGIRTSHNPPAPELLDLCDRMGFIVMDEAFDMWKKGKTQFDYSLDWDEWHKRDLEDMILRDRNHPSIFIWSIGNEVTEQYNHADSSGGIISRELCSLIRTLDGTRPITSNCNDSSPENTIMKNGSLDMIGYSYHTENYATVQKNFPGKSFIGSETVSALATRGSYDMPSDSIRRWPIRWDAVFTTGNTDFTCSAYDNCSAPWGSTQEETWRLVKKLNFVSGQYIWTGFDYLGEPTPYPWPARSSYFGIVDLAGFPKDAYYMYKSEWTKNPVLHVFPHWNWKVGDTVDVWAYTNCKEVELWLNGKSLGAKKKSGDDLHITWRVPFTPGTLKAIGRTGGKEILNQEIKTAGVPARMILEADRKIITADGKDLSFVTIKVLDAQGTLVPLADNLIQFTVSGEGKLVGVDNGLQTSLESFQASEHKAFHGLCLAVVQSKEKKGKILLNARSEGLQGSSISIEVK